MTKPFFFKNYRRNFTGTGNRNGRASIPFDRRVDWVSNVPLGDGEFEINSFLFIPSVDANVIYAAVPDPISFDGSVEDVPFIFTSGTTVNITFDASVADVDAFVTLGGVPNALTFDASVADVTPDLTTPASPNSISFDGSVADVDATAQLFVAPNSISFDGSVADVDATVVTFGAEDINFSITVADVAASIPLTGNPQSISYSSSLPDVEANLQVEPAIDPITATTSVADVEGGISLSASPQVIFTGYITSNVNSTLDEIIYPNEITGLIGWWDASDQSTLTNSKGGVISDGNFVDSWTDKVSGAIANVGGNSTLRPNWYAGGSQTIGNRGTVVFDGINHLLRVPSAVTVPAAFDNTSSLSICAVVEGDGGIFQIMHSGGGSKRVRRNVFTSITDSARAYDGSVWQTSGELAGPLQPSWTMTTFSYAIISQTMTLSAYNTGGVATNTVGPDSDFQADQANLISIGVFYEWPTYSLVERFDGKIGEILVYNRVISASDRAEIQRYFEHFWSI